MHCDKFKQKSTAHVVNTGRKSVDARIDIKTFSNAMEISSLNENLQLFLEYLCNPSQIRETYSLTSKNWIFCFFKSVIWILILSEKGFPCGSVGKEQPAQAGDIRDVVSIPGSGRSPGGHGNLLHYSCLENPIDRGNWQVAAHRVEKSRT